MSANFNDVGIPYGSQTLVLLATTTATTGITYIADNIDFQNPSKEILRTNQLDEPSGSVDYDDFMRATATLQRGTTTTNAPTKGYVCQLTPPGAAAAIWFRVFDFSTPQAKDQAHTFNVTFKKVITP
jgi:hypothetical protein